MTTLHFRYCIHAGNFATSHQPGPHYILHLWVTSNEPSHAPQKGDPVLSEGWVSPEPRAVYTSWLSPGTSGARGITSDSGYLCVLVLGWKLQGTDRAKRQTKALVPSCLVWSRGRLATLLSGQNIFPLFLLWRWLVKNISTWPWSLVAGTQLTTSWDPEMSSLVLCVCPFSPSRSIKQSPQRTWLVPLLIH